VARRIALRLSGMIGYLSEWVPVFIPPFPGAHSSMLIEINSKA